MAIAMEYPHIPYRHTEYPPEEMARRAHAFYEWLDRRRSLRFFSDRPVAQSVMDDLIRTASTAPSGAHKQPWTFCLVGNAGIKRQIRHAAEEEERLSYNSRMSDEWLQDLAPLGTDWRKDFLEVAPWLIVVFRKNFDMVGDKKRKNYYVHESVGLACGLLFAAIHNAGLVALPHTPSPMDFLARILGRPDTERPYLLVPVGYPAEGATVPDIHRKPLDEVRLLFL